MSNSSTTDNGEAQCRDAGLVLFMFFAILAFYVVALVDNKKRLENKIDMLLWLLADEERSAGARRNPRLLEHI
jgi:hypothetical protein